MFFRKIFSVFRKDYLNFIKKRHWLVLALFFILTAFFGYKTMKLSLKTDILELFPDYNENVLEYKKITELHGGEGYLIGVLEWNSPYKETISWLHSLIRETSQIRKELSEALSRADSDWLSEWLTQHDGKLKIKALIDFYQTIRKNIHEEMINYPQEKYLNLLNRELEIVIQDSGTRWNKFMQEIRNFDNGYAFLYSLDDNIFAFVQYIQSIKEQKGGKLQMQRFAQELTSQLEQEKDLISYTEYKFRTNYMKDRLLYFVEQEDLIEIKSRLEKKINYERRKKVISSPLLEDVPVDLSFTDIQEKYEQGPKVFKLTKNTALLEKTPGKYEFYINQKEDMMLVLIKPVRDSKDLHFNRQLIEKVNRITQDLIKKYPKELSIGFTGRYVKKVEDSIIIRNDLKLGLSLSVILILLFIYFTFRNIRSVMAIALTLAGGLIWTSGLVQILIGYFNVLSGFSIAILSGLGVIFAFHMQRRYIEERKRGRNTYQALEIVFDTTFISNLTTAITTAAAFFLLQVSSFKGFAQLGLISGMGILILLAVVFFVVPSILIISEKLKPLKIIKDVKHLERYRERRLPYYKIIIVMTILVTLFSFLGLFQFKFNANFHELASKNTLGRIYEKKAETLISMSLWPVVLYAKDWETMIKVSKKILDMKEQGDFPTLYKINTLFNYLPEDQEAKKKLLSDIQVVLNDPILSKMKNNDDKKKVDRLKDLTKAPSVSLSDIPEEVIRQFKGTEKGFFFFYYPKTSLQMSNMKILKELSQDIAKIKQGLNPGDILILSDALIFNDMLQKLKREGPVILLLLLFTILIILYFDFRKIKYALISLIPMITGLVWLLGLSYIIKIQFNYFSIMMIPVIIGVGINYGVHLIHRYKEEGNQNILFLFKTTGHSILLGAFINSIGFGTLILSNYKGLSSMGSFAMIGLIATAIASAFSMLAVLEIKKDYLKSGLKGIFFSKKTKENAIMNRK